MHKTAKQIAYEVLEKVAISGNMARRALSRKIGPKLLGGASDAAVLDDILSAVTKHPRTLNRAMPPGERESAQQIIDSISGINKKELLPKVKDIRESVRQGNDAKVLQEFMTRGGPDPAWVDAHPNWRM